VTNFSPPRRLAHDIHEILQLNSSGTGFLERLRDSTLVADPAPEQWGGIVDALHDDTVPGALEQAIINNVDVTSIHQASRKPDWPYGRAAHRRTIRESMLQHAKQLRSQLPAVSLAYFRAAFLLAAQEGMFIGPALLNAQFNEPQFAERSGWSSEMAGQLRERLKVYNAQTGRMMKHLIPAGLALQSLIDQKSDLDPSNVQTVISELGGFLGQAQSRPAHQWRAAHMVWVFVNHARDRNQSAVINRLEQAAVGWRNIANEPAFARWIAEAFSIEGPPMPSPGFRIVTPAQLEARGVRRQIPA
jgi:hypothetical protein